MERADDQFGFDQAQDMDFLQSLLLDLLPDGMFPGTFGIPEAGAIDSYVGPAAVNGSGVAKGTGELNISDVLSDWSVRYLYLNRQKT